jgi:peroxiredoxin
MKPEIRAGSTFPDYELPDHTDTRRKLSLLQGDDPMILMLLRGYYCPKDRQQLHQMVEFSKQCTVGYVRLVTITIDNLLQLNELRQGVGAEWTFLYDEERTIQRDLDIQEYTDPHHDPMIPHTFVLEPGLKIFKIYNGYWYWGRPSTAELHLDLRAVTEKIRPDWKIDTAEMREKWNAGEKQHFWPYGKSLREALVRMANAVDLYDKAA